MTAGARGRRTNRLQVFQRVSAVLRSGGSPDYILMVAVVGLLLIGLMMVYSATFDLSYQETGSSFAMASRHYKWTGLGVAVLLVLMFVPYDIWQNLAVPVMGVTLLLLILVLIVGDEIYGATRSFFKGSVQPAELAKLATVIYVAAWLVSKGDQIRDVTYGLIPFAVLIGLVAGLIMLQPDVSAAGLIVLTAVSMFFVAGADLLQLGIGSVVGGLTLWVVVTQIDYVNKRIEEFVPPWKDPAQLGVHSQRSLIALGNGGLLGVGLGQGQQKFGYLYTQHTDSIFGVVGEELGFVGCIAVVALFVLMAYRGFRIASQADSFGSVLASGITCLLVYQASVNVAVCTGLLPFIGVALPFLSYGGSAVTISLTGVGILLSISRGNRIGKRSRFSTSMDSWWRNRGARVSRSGSRSSS